jgi:hypothetical protein
MWERYINGKMKPLWAIRHVSVQWIFNISETVSASIRDRCDMLHNCLLYTYIFAGQATSMYTCNKQLHLLSHRSLMMEAD